MRRREFFQGVGVVSVASLPFWAGSAAAQGVRGGGQTTSADTLNVWHFHDRWTFDRLDGLKLSQGVAQWQRDEVFVEPNIGALSAWPTVYRDNDSGRWRMLYSAGWKPYQLMISESEEGRRWRPMPQAATTPAGQKRAAHHLFTLPGGSGGGVYLDPIAADGFPFKVFAHQRGDEVLQRAVGDPRHPWHKIAKAEGAKKYLVEDFTLVSANGIEWQTRRDLVWSRAGWHPEPPIFGFYNHHLRRHAMTVRPGWGDRRQALQSSNDCKVWSGPELILQPDALDDELVEFYGMPVFPYGDGYVGLLWVFHCESRRPTEGFNRFVGSIDCQLAFSHDGQRFRRGLRTPLIACNEPGEHGAGAIEPSCMVQTDDEIRIYSAATRLHHGKGSEAKRNGIGDNASILLHTLRKDGLMFLQCTGDWGEFVSRPLVLLNRDVTINVDASGGEVEYQLLDLQSRPVEGFTFDQCARCALQDSTRFPLRWQNADLAAVKNRIVRLQMRLRHARLYAIAGKLHFIDAQDRWMLEDGKPMDA